MRVKKNDTVKVITGKDAGKTGKVLVALPNEGRIVVEGVNVQKKHKKARSAQDVSKIEEQNGAIQASNVMVVCPKCDKATRVAYKTEGDKKIRVCKKCGAALDAPKEVKETKKAAKKSADGAEKKPAAKKSASGVKKSAKSAESAEKKTAAKKSAEGAEKKPAARKSAKAKAESADKAE